MLIYAASRARKAAEKREPGWLFDNLATMTFSALAIEALCNSIGERLIPDWADFENSSPNAKLRILANRLGINYDKDGEPWSSARWLVKFRNLVAHAKPELIVQEVLLTQEEHDKRQFNMPESRLEKQITDGNADRALRAAEQLKDMLIDKLTPDEKFGLSVDGWSGSTKLQVDA